MKLSETILHPTFECDEENIVWLSDEIEKIEDELKEYRIALEQILSDDCTTGDEAYEIAFDALDAHQK